MSLLNRFNTEATEPQQASLQLIWDWNNLPSEKKNDFLKDRDQRARMFEERKNLWRKIEKHADIRPEEKKFLKSLSFHPELFDKEHVKNIVSVLQTPASMEFGRRLLDVALKEGRSGRNMALLVRDARIDNVDKLTRMLREDFFEAKSRPRRKDAPELVDPLVNQRKSIESFDGPFREYFNGPLLEPLHCMQEADQCLARKMDVLEKGVKPAPQQLAFS
jgi:hypothetical protein